MDISVLTTTNDIEQLRTLALAMVQKVMAENEEKEKLQQRIRLLEEMLKLARRQRFGKKASTCECDVPGTSWWRTFRDSEPPSLRRF